MLLNDCMAKYEEQPFELIDGEIFIVKPIVYGISTIHNNIYLQFLLYLQESQVGEVYGMMPFVVMSELDTVKNVYKPYILYLEKFRLNQYYKTVDDYNDKPLLLVPDIVVEITWSFNPKSHVNRKVQSYLSDGVKIVWVVDPQRKIVEEFTLQNTDGVKKRNDDVLSGGDVAKGFELKVSEIFE